MPEVLHSDDLMAGVFRFVDMSSAINCRAVCKQWKKLVSEGGMDPLEAGTSDEELDKGPFPSTLPVRNAARWRAPVSHNVAVALPHIVSREETLHKPPTDKEQTNTNTQRHSTRD